MGRSTSSSICPNVASLSTFNGLMRQEDEDDLLTLSGGWKKVPGCGTYLHLYTDVFEKDDLQVQLVNTAFYSNGGEEDWVVFSDDVGAVQTFLSDHGIQTKIHAQESVHQTL